MWIGAGAALTATSFLALRETECDDTSDFVIRMAYDKIYLLEKRVDEMQVALSGKTNSAFVFVKPHAAGKGGKVEKLVEERLKDSGIRVTGNGVITAESIDKNMFIDKHYGAIASKAVVLKPSELNVPEKGKKQFQEMFGMSWEDAIAQGKVYNAKDACEKLSCDGAGLEKKWRKLTRGKDLIKFGGGFYCGFIEDGIFVMNGFYMSMRSAYCTPGKQIHYYTVSWPADSLSWEDFRGKVLGATNPREAPKGSIRREILENYKELGLESEPNVGDNGVHASASPFEGLAERMNWLGCKLEDDEFGKGLLSAGVSERDISQWRDDAQVKVEGETAEGKTMSVFDTFEDLDADAVLAKARRVFC